MTHIVLVGSSGQVGCELQRTLAPLGTLTSWTRSELDLSHLNVVAEAIAQLQPDVIVNAAAYTAVDRAETEPDLADAVNSRAPGQLARAAAEVGATLVHLSTDYVFDGRQSTPYGETDITAPLGVYGQTKLDGENAIRAASNRHCIIRTAWVYGCQGKGNFVKTMLRLGADREELRVVADQIGSPTWAQDIARTIAHIVPQLGPETFGTYHFTNSGVASWYDLAVAVFEEARQLGLPLSVQRVIPITTADYPTPARRPSFSVLNCQRVATTFGCELPHWRSSLRKMLHEWVT